MANNDNMDQLELQTPSGGAGGSPAPNDSSSHGRGERDTSWEHLETFLRSQSRDREKEVTLANQRRHDEIHVRKGLVQ